ARTSAYQIPRCAASPPSLPYRKSTPLPRVYTHREIFRERGAAVKIKSFLLVLIFALTPVMWPQEQPAQAPPGPGVGDQMRPEHRQQMMEMHKQEMQAMKADV